MELQRPSDENVSNFIKGASLKLHTIVDMRVQGRILEFSIELEDVLVQESFHERNRMETSSKDAITRTNGPRRDVSNLDDTWRHVLLHGIHNMFGGIPQNIERSQQNDKINRVEKLLHVGQICPSMIPT